MLNCVSDMTSSSKSMSCLRDLCRRRLFPETTVNLCVSCVSGKSVEGGPKLRNYLLGDLTLAIRKWAEDTEVGLEDNNVGLQCRCLYLSPLWGMFAETYDSLPPTQRRLWILSAGLGLVEGEDAAHYTWLRAVHAAL